MVKKRLLSILIATALASAVTAHLSLEYYRSELNRRIIPAETINEKKFWILRV
ncbi:hypothetical protein J4440_03550 [Candidatus Woesearchaeota archaeon]|nr:hypothetical protein [Candidatus Woesearchaeota archaeon]